MKYFILAGEPSGDLHGSNLIRAIKQQDSKAEFQFWGGDLMAAESGGLLKHIRELAFMGFIEVVKNLRTIKRNFAICKEQIVAFQPDAIVYIDYPGFNLRMAKWSSQQGFSNYYYISPQVWAWKAKRVYKIRDYVDQLYTILPFEKDFFAKYDVDVSYVGHPLVPIIEAFQPDETFRSRYNINQPIIALLPGSREQEVARMLSTMLQIVDGFSDYQFCIAGTSSIDEEQYRSILASTGINPDRLRIINNETYQLLAHSEAALVTSGTATLETALFGVPEVVCYSGSAVSYQIAKRLIRVPYISLVNLIADRPMVKELIQGDFTPENLSRELNKILEPAGNKHMRSEMAELRNSLTENLNAPELVATDIVSRLIETTIS